MQRIISSKVIQMRRGKGLLEEVLHSGFFGILDVMVTKQCGLSWMAWHAWQNRKLQTLAAALSDINHNIYLLWSNSFRENFSVHFSCIFR